MSKKKKIAKSNIIWFLKANWRGTSTAIYTSHKSIIQGLQQSVQEKALHRNGK